MTGRCAGIDDHDGGRCVHSPGNCPYGIHVSVAWLATHTDRRGLLQPAPPPPLEPYTDPWGDDEE